MIGKLLIFSNLLFVSLAIISYLYLADPLKFRSKKQSLPSANQVVLITGATDGIGQGYAEQLAKLENPPKLILIGRSEEKLKKIKNTLLDINSNVNVTCLNHDFSKFLESDLKVDVDKIDWVIHCAGVSYEAALYLHEVPSTTLQNIINVNLVSTGELIRAIIRLNGDNKFTFIYCGSASAIIKEPFMSVYSASKAAAKTLIESVNSRFVDTNTLFKVHTPFLITTKMSKIRKNSLFIPNVKTYVKAALNDVTLSDNKSLFSTRPVSNPYSMHVVLQVLYYYIVPRLLWNYSRVQTQKRLRKRYLKKLDYNIKMNENQTANTVKIES